MENRGEGVVGPVSSSSETMFRFDTGMAREKTSMATSSAAAAMFDGRRVFEAKGGGGGAGGGEECRTPLRPRCVNTIGAEESAAAASAGGSGSAVKMMAALSSSPFTMVRNPLLEAAGMETPPAAATSSAQKRRKKKKSSKKTQMTTPRSAKKARRDIDTLRVILGDSLRQRNNSGEEEAEAAPTRRPRPLLSRGGAVRVRIGNPRRGDGEAAATSSTDVSMEPERNQYPPGCIAHVSEEPSLALHQGSAVSDGDSACARSPPTLSRLGPSQEATSSIVGTPRATPRSLSSSRGGISAAKAARSPVARLRHQHQQQQRTEHQQQHRGKTCLGLRRKGGIAKTPSKRARVAAASFCSSSYLSGTRWMEKQERAYTTWINHVMMTDKVLRVRLRFNANGGVSAAGSAAGTTSSSAGSDGDESMLRQSAMLRMRTRMWKLYSSEGEFVQKLLKIEKSVDSGKLSLERGGAVIRDVRIRAKTVAILRTYSELWLRMGVETVLGLHSSDEQDIATLVSERFLGAATGIKTDSQCTTVSKLVLKRFLVLVALLDEAASTLKLNCMPPLFVAAPATGSVAGGGAGPKSSADVVRQFLREFVKGEGDVLRHLRFLGYKLRYKQELVDEYDFRVTNLAVDLRDGLRLGKITELLVPGADVVSKMSLPAAVRSVKIANTELALAALRDAKDHFGTMSNTRATDLVDGNRERTLGLLWAMMIQFQIPSVVDERDLDSELSRLDASRCRMSPSSTIAVATSPMRATRDAGTPPTRAAPTSTWTGGAPLPAAVQAHGGLALKLFLWSSAVAAKYDLEIFDFTSSFADGRALCYLVSFYLPHMLPSTEVFCGRDNSDLAERRRRARCEPCAELLALRVDDGGGAGDLEFKEGVRRNFRLLASKSALLGGVPHLLPSVDAHPDERCVISFLSFLCSRLLDINKEQRAACTIQGAWRWHMKAALVAAATASSGADLADVEAAATKIQAAARGRIARRSYCRMATAAATLQSAVRRFLARRRDRRRMDAAAIVVQKMFRGYMERVRLHREFITPMLLARGESNLLILRENRYTARVSAPLVRIQAATRAWLARRSFLAIRNAAIRMQATFRMSRAMRDYAATRRAAVAIQASFRGFAARHQLAVAVDAVVCIQRHVRGYCRRVRFARLREAAITAQSLYRQRCAVEEVGRLRVERAQHEAARTIQARARARRQMLEYQRMRRASVVIQARVRGMHARSAYVERRRSAITIQRAFRRRRARQAMREDGRRVDAAAVRIQAAFRGARQRAAFLALRQTATLLQSSARMTRERRRFLQKKDAALRIQAAFRATLARRTSQALREEEAAVRIQSFVRARLQHARFTEVRRALVLVQAHARAALQRRHFLRMRSAAVVIQASFRRHASRARYGRVQAAALVIQTSFRRSQAARHFWRLRDEQARLHNARVVEVAAAVRIQSAFRRVLAIREAERLRESHRRRRAHAAVRIQSIVRGSQARGRYAAARAAAICIQANVRARQARARFQRQRAACVRVQSAFRRYMAEGLARRLRDAAARERHAAALRIQRSYRRWAAARAEQLEQERHQRRRESSATRIQCAWRGYVARRSSSKLMSAIRVRFIEAARRGKLHPELRLGNRARVAITTLMESKRLTEALRGCTILEQSTSYSHVICELLVSSHAVPKLFRFIRSCNRSKPHMELVVNILGILNNIARYHWLTQSISEIPGAMITLVEQLQSFRDKRAPFILCIGILRSIFSDRRRQESVDDKAELKHRIGLIVDYHARRAAMERKCIACAKPGSSVASLVEAKRKLADSVAQREALAAIAVLLDTTSSGAVGLGNNVGGDSKENNRTLSSTTAKHDGVGALTRQGSQVHERRRLVL